MIGMNQIKKRFLYGILVGALIGILGIAGVVWYSSTIIKSYKNGTNEDFLQNYTAMVFTFTRDVIQGEAITADMITQTRVHANMVPVDVADQSGLLGRVAKYNISQGAVATNGMVSDDILQQDERIYEFNSINLPTNIRVGDYVDIKFKIPSGIEYVVLPQVKLIDISGTNIWLRLSEAELLQLNSAIIDSYVTVGSVLYAVEYADATTQIKLDEAAKDAAKLYITNKISQEILGIGEGYTAENLVDIITKYALEYRYYVESYSETAISYQPNEQIIRYMQNNASILDTAKAYLSSAARDIMEGYIVDFESTYSDRYSDIISKIEASITQQQSLRISSLDTNTDVDWE